MDDVFLGRRTVCMTCGAYIYPEVPCSICKLQSQMNPGTVVGTVFAKFRMPVAYCKSCGWRIMDMVGSKLYCYRCHIWQDKPAKKERGRHKASTEIIEYYTPTSFTDKSAVITKVKKVGTIQDLVVANLQRHMNAKRKQYGMQSKGSDKKSSTHDMKYLKHT